MSAPMHTPGPWRAERREHQSVVLQAGGRQDGYLNRIAVCPQWTPAPFPQPTADEAFANARLIAAAPELLEALESLRATLNGNGYATAHANAAIAKAKGNTE